MLVVITIALFAVIGTAIFIIKNLLLQLEALEDRVIFYEESFNTIREQVLNTEIELKELDIRGSFEADDEVGFVFKQIQEINNELLKK